MGAEILCHILADMKATHMLVTQSEPGRGSSPTEAGEAGCGRLTKGERFGAHVVLYFIGVWNLFAINAARTPGEWWFWIPAAAWLAGLAAHALWLLAGRLRPASRQAGIRREGCAP